MNAAKVSCEFVSKYNTAELLVEIRQRGVEAPPDVEQTPLEADTIIQQILEDNNFRAKIRDLDEWGEALGGGFLKPYNDGDNIIIDYIPAGSFWPLSWNNRRFTEGIFVSTYASGDDVFTRLEVHQFEEIDGGENVQLIIRNRLFRSDSKDELGEEVPLSTYEPLADILPESRFDRDKPLFAYFRPAIANNIEFEIPFGISRFHNGIDALEMIDDAYHGWDRERNKTHTRVWYTPFMVKRAMDDEGKVGARIDEEQDSYEVLNTVTPDSQQPFFFAPEYRIEKRAEDVDSNLNIYCLLIGLSPGSITFKSNIRSDRTATEVKYDGDSTFSTVGNNQDEQLRPAIEDLIDSVLFLGQHQDFNLIPPGDYEINVSLNDGIKPTHDTLVKEAVALKDAKIYSTYTALRTLDWSHADALAEVDRIKQESAVVSDVFGNMNFGGE